MPMSIDPHHRHTHFPTSSARSDPLPPRPPAPSAPAPRPPTSALAPQPRPLPVQISPGVWEDADENIFWDSNWPPVHDYLQLLRSKRRFIDTDDIVFALAALHVIYDPSDIAHGLLWAPNSIDAYYRHAKRVNRVFTSKPREIKSDVPWNGAREYKCILNAFQEKYYYQKVLGIAAPTCQIIEPRKRNLRSSGALEDRQHTNFGEYFEQLVEPESPPIIKRRRKVVKQSLPSPSVTRSGGPAKVTNESVPRSVPPAHDLRSSARTKRRTSPSGRTPRILSTPKTKSAAVASNVDLTSPSSSSPTVSSPPSPLDRSTSPSSVDTLVAGDSPPKRDTSVESACTAVAQPAPKKRKRQSVYDETLDDTRAFKRQAILECTASQVEDMFEFVEGPYASRNTDPSEVESAKLRYKTRRPRSD